MDGKKIIKVYQDIPAGAKVFSAFSKQQGYCEGNLNQVHTISDDVWIDLGLEWDAIDVDTVQATWPHITIIVSIDGDEIESPKQISTKPYKTVLECENGIHTGIAIKNELYLVPLAIGEHKVNWEVRFKRDINDGWNVYLKERVILITSTLHIRNVRDF
jgi:hypothetical protein